MALICAGMGAVGLTVLVVVLAVVYSLPREETWWLSPFGTRTIALDDSAFRISAVTFDYETANGGGLCVQPRAASRPASIAWRNCSDSFGELPLALRQSRAFPYSLAIGSAITVDYTWTSQFNAKFAIVLGADRLSSLLATGDIEYAAEARGQSTRSARVQFGPINDNTELFVVFYTTHVDEGDSSPFRFVSNLTVNQSSWTSCPGPAAAAATHQRLSVDLGQSLNFIVQAATEPAAVAVNGSSLQCGAARPVSVTLHARTAAILPLAIGGWLLVLIIGHFTCGRSLAADSDDGPASTPMVGAINDDAPDDDFAPGEGDGEAQNDDEESFPHSASVSEPW